MFYFLIDLWRFGIRNFSKSYKEFKKICVNENDSTKGQNPIWQLWGYIKTSKITNNFDIKFDEDIEKPRKNRIYYCPKCGKFWEAPSEIVCSECAKKQDDIYYRQIKIKGE